LLLRSCGLITEVPASGLNPGIKCADSNRINLILRYFQGDLGLGVLYLALLLERKGVVVAVVLEDGARLSVGEAKKLAQLGKSLLGRRQGCRLPRRQNKTGREHDGYKESLHDF